MDGFLIPGLACINDNKILVSSVNINTQLDFNCFQKLVRYSISKKKRFSCEISVLETRKQIALYQQPNVRRL